YENPIRAMWPQTHFICTQMKNKMARQVENPRRSMDLMNQLKLTVKQVGRKVLLSGEMEKKEESEGDSYSYRYQEFRQELKLQEDVKPRGLSCALNNGHLLIEAPRMTLPSIPKNSDAQ
ncbi:HSPBB protein, partial [Polypterus senegalus]|nr:HSPBB protein [Polypterus senegalus]